MNLEKRNIATCVILSIVTCGIYSIYWVVMLLKQAVMIKDPNDSGTTEVVLGILLNPVGLYLAEKKFDEGCKEKGIQHEDHSIIYLVLGFVGLGIVSMCIMQSDMNNTIDQLSSVS